jgi:hypothetical protein
MHLTAPGVSDLAFPLATHYDDSNLIHYDIVPATTKVPISGFSCTFNKKKRGIK